MTGYLLQQHPVLEKPSFHPYPPIISLFHHTQVVSQQTNSLFLSSGSLGPLCVGFDQVPLRLRSNWPQPDASVKNNVWGPNTFGVFFFFWWSTAPPCQVNGPLCSVMLCTNELQQSHTQMYLRRCQCLSGQLTAIGLICTGSERDRSPL